MNKAAAVSTVQQTVCVFVCTRTKGCVAVITRERELNTEGVAGRRGGRGNKASVKHVRDG